MKTITIDDKKIEISDESYEAFKKQFMTEDKAILWKPEEDGEYWFTARSDTTPERVLWCNDAVDRSNYELGNIFKTQQEAQEALDTGWVAKRKAEVKILRFIAENDLEWDWDSDDVNKYYVFYSHNSRSFGETGSRSCQHSILPCFKSGEDAQKVIDAMTPELKILFGVK